MDGVNDFTSRLLVAVPRERAQVVDGDVFDRSVVLVLHHDGEDAHGLILNRPLTAEVDVILPGWQEHVSAPNRVFQGGPVSLDTALGLASMPGGNDETIGVKRLFGGVCLVDLDAPPPVVMPSLSALRIYAGYAGWSPNQLEAEIEEGHWFVVDAEALDPFSDNPLDLWEHVLLRQRSPLAFAAKFPADPDLN